MVIEQLSSVTGFVNTKGLLKAFEEKIEQRYKN